jgi:acetyl esterase/lipase
MSTPTTRITSDLTLNTIKFDPKQVTEETIKIKSALRDMTLNAPKWTAAGAAEFRRQQEAGETSLPPPVLLPGAYDIDVPSRDSGRNIRVRVYKPDNKEPSRGLILHIHGGGFVVGAHNQ